MRKLIPILALTLFAPMVVAKDPTKGTTFKTPQEVIKAANKAMAKRDYKAFYIIMSKASKKDALGSTIRRGISAAQSESTDPRSMLRKEKILAAFKKHGVSKEAVMGFKRPDTKTREERNAAYIKLVAKVKDVPSLLGEIMNARDAGREVRPMPAVKLVDLKITGKKATGFLVMTDGGRERKQPMMFLKEGNSWTLAIHESEKSRRDTVPAKPVPPAVVPKKDKEPKKD